MSPCNCHPPFPRPEPFSPLPRPGKTPDWGKWIRDRLAEKGALLVFPTRASFPSPGAWPNLYLDQETGAVYRWDREDYAVLFGPREGNDVLVYDSVAAFPDEGEQGKLYIAANTGSLYRWGGEGYVALLPGKADKVVPAAEGNLAELTQDGNLADSGKKPADFADAENTYTKAETDEAIDRVAAYYITRNAAGDAFETKAQLNSATVFYSGGKVRTPTRNDYCVVLADETHDNAEYRYIYAVADGETTGSWQPQFPVEGVMTIDQTVTKNSTNPVASGGVWSAIWGALSAIPAGFSSLYDWCVAQLAGKASTADATLTERGFTEWDCNPSTVLVNGVNYPAVVYRLVIGRDVYWALGADVGAPPFTAQPYDETATSLTFSLSDSFEPHTVVATREALSGYQLGSQSDKPLQPAGDYAPATNIAKTALGQDVQTSLGKADTAIQGVKVNGTEITPDAQKKVNLEVATKADATLTEKWTPTFALTDAQKEVFSQTPGASDNDYALTIVPSSSTESYLLYVGSYNAASFRKIQSDSTNLIFDGGDARLGLQPGDLVATLNGYTLGSQSDKPLASEAEAEALRTGKQNALSQSQLDNIAAVPSKANDADVVHKSGGTMTGSLTIERSGDNIKIDGSTIRFNDEDGNPTGGTISGTDGGGNVSLPTSDGTLALIAPNPTAGNLAALDANGNPTNSTIPAANVATKGNIPYDLVAKTIDNGAVTLDDRAINAVAVSSSLASLTVNFPTATSGKARDFGLRLTVASGITTAPELVLPQGVTCENADGEAPEIGADGAATILYFTETASGVFLVKGEVLRTITA